MIAAPRRLWLIPALLIVTTAGGQESDPVAPLAVKQDIVRDRVLRLEDHMYRLIDTLREQEPAQAKRLEKALARMGELGIRQDLQGIVELLGRDQLDQALQQQESLLGDLGSLLELLMAEEDDPQQLEEEIKRLEALLKDVEELITTESQHLDDTRTAEDQITSGAPDPRLAAAIQDLLSQQQELNRQTAARNNGEEAPESAALGDAQEQLRQRTSELAEALQQQGEAESADRLSSAAENMDDAVLDMNDDTLGAALDAQEDALSDLEQALEQLTKKPDPEARPPDFDAMADAQSQTAAGAKELSRKMTAQGGATPGQDNVEMAGKNMDQAAEQLSDKQDPAAAGEQQDQALQQLEQARDQMQQRIDELKRQLQQQKLADLEARFRQMLVQQETINTRTRELNQLAADQWRRTHQLQAIEQGRNEQQLADQAGACLEILEEDATTTVLPELVAQLRDDMGGAGERLLDAKVGAATQAIQQEIVATLEDILTVLEQDPQPPSNQDNAQQQQQQQAAQGDPPLLPNSAELKLLTQLQERLFKRTRQAHREGQPDMNRLLRIAEKQKQVGQMTEAMNRKLKQSAGPPGAGP